MILKRYSPVLEVSSSLISLIHVQCLIKQWKGSHWLCLPNREDVLMTFSSSPMALVVLFFPLFPSSATRMKESGDYRSILPDPRGPFSLQKCLCLRVWQETGSVGSFEGFSHSSVESTERRLQIPLLFFFLRIVSILISWLDVLLSSCHIWTFILKHS